MRSTIFASLVTLLSLTSAAPTDSEGHVRHETRADHSPWMKREVIPANLVLPMRIGLTQSNLDQGHDLLMEVSDPNSSKYGNFYTNEEVHDLFAPSEESVDTVRAWLERSGISADRVSQSANKQWLQFDIATHEAEELLKTKMYIYENAHNGKMSIGCDAYHVHRSTKDHIDYITPGLKMIEIKSEFSDALRKRSTAPIFTGPIKTGFPAFTNVANASTTLHYCDTLITPNCIFAMYNISTGTTATAGNQLGIYEETPEYVDQADLNLYFEQVYPQIPNNTFPAVRAIDGAKNINKPGRAGTEALLDFEISYPIIYPQNSVLFLTDDVAAAVNFTGGLFNTFLDAIDGSYCTFSAFNETGDSPTLDPTYPNTGYNHSQECGVFKPTNVISLSYQLAEYNEGTTASYQKRQCLEYMKLGMQGVTVVFSSGDAGVESRWGCQANATGAQTIFNPGFPSSCPYVTSVGATALVGEAIEDREIATTQFPSGGGFSNYWPRPSYQDTAVDAFFNGSNAPKYPYYTGSTYGNGIYNRSGRGFPDVSAIGQAVVNFGGGLPYLVGGTSASAPVVAAMITRINEERLANGQKPVGFVNPVLYQNPQAFHDITVGTNKGCGTKGFQAGPGWDPVTGLGTPNYPALLEVFVAAGAKSITSR